MVWLNWLPQTAAARTLLTLVDAATLVRRPRSALSSNKRDFVLI
jgi:hypothetical protein